MITYEEYKEKYKSWHPHEKEEAIINLYEKYKLTIKEE